MAGMTAIQREGEEGTKDGVSDLLLDSLEDRVGWTEYGTEEAQQCGSVPQMFQGIPPPLRVQ
jgi:hypothetical protein